MLKKEEVAKLKAKLTPEQQDVCFNKGTEMPFTGEYWDNHEEGSYSCAVCGAELFDSKTKFESGTGWPSFDRAKADGTIIERSDRSHWMVRTEIVCAKCGGHLGHVFSDGPTETGKRYCVKSLSLTYEQEAGQGGGLGQRPDQANDGEQPV